MKKAVDAHTDADGITHVLDMNIAGTEFVGLVDEVVEDFFGGDAGQSLRDFGNGSRITFAGNLDVVIVDDFRRVIAEHKDFIGGIRD